MEKYAEYLNYQTIPEAIAALFGKSDKTAVICGNESITYRELLTRSRELARILKDHGVQKGDRIVLSMDRSVSLIVSVLGILYAGAAYVPVERGCPKERLSYILRDSGAHLTLDRDMLQELREESGKEKNRAGFGSPEDEGALPVLLGEDEFAVYYTSGSTGTPKGCVVHHQVYYHFSMPMEQNLYAFEVRENVDRCLSLLNFAFVGSSFDVFIVLLCGKTLVLTTEEERLSPALTGTRMLESRAGSLHITTSQLLSYAVDPVFRQAMGQIRCLVFGGEPLPEKARKQLAEYYSGCILFTYGATEVGTVTGCRLLPGDMVHLGKPFFGTELYVLDSAGNPAQEGMEGEVCVGGVASQLGYYVGKRELTGQKYTQKEGLGRIYHTGDRAIRRTDGRITVLGRIDNMRKLHGQRIELEEVEHCLEAFPGISRAAADIRGEGPEAALFAWYTTEEKVPSKAEENSPPAQAGFADFAAVGHGASSGICQERVLDFLRERLPEYMIPKRLQAVKAFPLSRNGKLQRQKLPDIEAKREDYLPPETKEEEMICRLFEQILRLDRVGRNESFFALGGNSVLAMFLISSLREESGQSLSVADLFANPYPSSLAEILAEKREEEAPAQSSDSAWDASLLLYAKDRSGPLYTADRPGVFSIPPEISEIMEEEGAEAAFPADLSTAKFFMLEQFGASIGQKAVPRVRADLNCFFSEHVIREKVNNLIRRHPALRSHFVTDMRGKLWQVFLRQKEGSVWYKDISHLDRAAQEQFLSGFFKVMEEAGDALQVGCFRTDEERSTLLLSFDHSQADGFSIKLMVNELAGDEKKRESDRFYEYRAKRLRHGNDFPGELREYYRSLEPTYGRRQGPFGRANDAAVRIILLTREQTEKITRLCGRKNLTVSAFVNYCYGKCLLMMTGREELLLSCLFSGRDPAFRGSEEIVGNLVFPIPVRICAGMTFEEFGRSLMILWEYPYITDTKAYARLLHYDLEGCIVSRDLQLLHENIIFWDDYSDQNLMGNCLELRDGRLKIILNKRVEKCLDPLRNMLLEIPG